MIFAALDTSWETSWGAVPSEAFETQARSRRTGARFGAMRLKLSAPPPETAVWNSLTMVVKSRRLPLSNVERTSLSWVGIAVCESGMVPPFFISGALGLPACMST